MHTPGLFGIFAAHWASLVQGPQLFIAQIGFDPTGQSPSDTQPTHRPASTSHTSPPSTPPSEHWFDDVHLNGASPASSASPPSLASRMSAPPSVDIGMQALSIGSQLCPLGQSPSFAQYLGFLLVQ